MNVSIAGFIRTNLDRIAKLKYAGYSTKSILEIFAQEGMVISPVTFRDTLYRMKKKYPAVSRKAASSIIASQDQVEKPKSAITPTKPKIPFVLKEVPDDEKY